MLPVPMTGGSDWHLLLVLSAVGVACTHFWNPLWQQGLTLTLRASVLLPENMRKGKKFL